jgi:hypothetical protein
VHGLLHCHFESALRALAVARPGELERLRPVQESPAYASATPAGRLGLLDQQVTTLTKDQGLFSRDVFAEIVRRLGEEMTGSGIGHIDLRVGVIMRRWPWIASLADAIRAFRAELPGPDTLTVSFLGAVNLSRPHRNLLDVVFGRIMEDTRAGGLLAGLDINMQPADLATLDLYLDTLLDLQRSGLLISIHLGELFGAEFSGRSSPASSPAG